MVDYFRPSETNRELQRQLDLIFTLGFKDNKKSELWIFFTLFKMSRDTTNLFFVFPHGIGTITQTICRCTATSASSGAGCHVGSALPRLTLHGTRPADRVAVHWGDAEIKASTRISEASDTLAWALWVSEAGAALLSLTVFTHTLTKQAEKKKNNKKKKKTCILFTATLTEV